MTCARCGTEVADGSIVCPQCGALFGVPQPPPAEGQAPNAPQSGSPQYSYPVPYPPQYPQNYQAYTPPPPNDPKAIVSLVCGILSLLICYVGVLLGIAAIVLGHISRAAIRKSAGQVRGEGMALAGLIMGYISLLYIPVLAAIFFFTLMNAKATTNEASARAWIHRVNTAQISYEVAYPEKGFAPDLATLAGNCDRENGSGSTEPACLIKNSSLGAPTCTGDTWCTKSNYKFMLKTDASEPHEQYVITAIPVSVGNLAKRGFCSTQEADIHVDASPGKRTDPYTEQECEALPKL